jgi:hypothetical protein
MFPKKGPSGRLLLVLLGCGALAAGPAGCGGGPKLAQVSGKVTVGDEALRTGFVIFYPDAAKGNASMDEPRGDIDAEGRYTLSTGARPGASPGWYRVAVAAADQLDPNNPYFTNWLIPEKYIDPKTSQLAVEVVETPTPGAYDFKLDPK